MKLRWIAVLALTAATLFAQGPRGGGPPRAAADLTPPAPTELKTALGLTDAQVAALIKLQDQKRTQLEPIMQQIATQRTALRDALAKTNPDAFAIAAILTQIQSLEKQVSTIDASFQTQAIATLNADQKTKLKNLETAQSLMPAVHQAVGLDLLSQPACCAGAGPGGMGGPGPGPRGFGGGMMRSPGPGRARQ